MSGKPDEHHKHHADAKRLSGTGFPKTAGDSVPAFRDRKKKTTDFISAVFSLD
jgi:hypothetical protein